jgi:hypothetical protein
MKRNFTSFLSHNATKLKKIAEKQQSNMGKSGGHFVLKESSNHAIQQSSTTDLSTSNSNSKAIAEDQNAKKLKVDSAPPAANPPKTTRLFEFLSKNRFGPAQQ